MVLSTLHTNDAPAAATRMVDLGVPAYLLSSCLVGVLALLPKVPSPTDTDIDQALSGNLCRCGTYQRIRAAVHRAADIGKA